MYNIKWIYAHVSIVYKAMNTWEKSEITNTRQLTVVSSGKECWMEDKRFTFILPCCINLNFYNMVYCTKWCLQR